MNRGALFLLLTILGWGLGWPANKVILESMSPYWFAALRSGIAALALLLFMLPRGQLALPPRSDLPVVFGIALLHMVGFAVFAAIGLGMVQVGRSMVLAYTSPLWVIPGAALVLGERLTPRRVIGMLLGLAGLAVLFNPLAFDWHDRNSVLGHASLLAAALCWSMSILHIRAHKWRSTPFQLVPWEMFVATVVLAGIALASGTWVAIAWTPKLALLLFFTSTFGTVLPYWAVASAGRSMPASSVSLGLLATPIVGIIAATLALGEAPDVVVWTAMALVTGGVLIGTRNPEKAQASPASPPASRSGTPPPPTP
jgi:drug/metabolite transporter (DMT)-like permease